MEKIKLELCKQFIKMLFEEKKCKKMETSLFFDLATEVGLFNEGNYGGPMSKALEELCTVEHVKNEYGNYAYNVFVLKEGI